MRETLTIAWKDFKLIVLSPMFLLIAGICSAIWSLSFLNATKTFVMRSSTPPQFGGAQNMNLHYSVFIQHISFVNIIFIFAIPALTMRLIAEEKKMRTYDLLLTVPVTSKQIALGKFLAGFGVAGSLVLVSLLYPLSMFLFADFPVAPLVSSYFGLLMMAGTYVAIGLFASSVTQSVMLSMILGVLFNLVLWFISQASSFSDNPSFAAVMEHLNVGQNLLAFLKGTYDLSAFTFFLSMMVLFVFLSERVIESSRWR
jgi:ABC-2 type transport system permease protein